MMKHFLKLLMNYWVNFDVKYVKFPDVVAYNDYYPFGSLVPNRHGSSSSYRYGFQGQEKDDELKGEGNSLNYTFRMHDPRVGRFFAVDPLTKKYPFYSPYQFSGNRVMDMVELEGLEPKNTKVNADSQPKGCDWERTDSAGNYTGEAYPPTDLEDVVVKAPESKLKQFFRPVAQAVSNGINGTIGAVTGASYIPKNAVFNSAYLPSTDNKDVAIMYGVLAAPVAAVVAVEAGVGAGIVASYEAYCSWYAGTSCFKLYSWCNCNWCSGGLIWSK